MARYQTFPLAVLLAISVIVSPLPADEPTAARPNVILVLTDDQGYGDLSCHGNPVLKTPNLDRLHAESVRLTDFHVSPMCTPTRGELLTGTAAIRSGAYCACSGRTFLRRQLPTMPEIFANSGYCTAIFGKWHLGDNYPHRPQDRGFERAVYHLGWGITSTPDYWNNDYFDDFFRVDGTVRQFPGYCTDVWFDEALRWINKHSQRGDPLFVYIATNAPHGPFFAPEKYKQPYQHLDRDTAGFFAMVANIDENMARLDKMLAESGLRDNTLLIFMTDNGGTGGIKVYNAGMRGAKASLYEGGHRVPCFLRWPGGRLRSAGDVGALTHVTDLLPTLADLCRLKLPSGCRFDGISLAPLLAGREQPELARRMAVVQYGGLDPTHPQKWDSAVLWNRWRLVRGKELYSVEADPGQERDVASEHPDVVGVMRAHYQAWWKVIQPAMEEFETIVLGSEHENPARLTSLDWLAPKLVPAAQPFDIRQLGVPVVEGSLPLGRPMPLMNAPWNVEIARAGTYRISLRRWPREADAAVTAPLPAYEGVDGDFPPGKALPAAGARLKVAGIDLREPVRPEAKAVTFTTPLPAGKTTLQTWFYDAKGKELCGAFYVEVERLQHD
ncbi:MAG: arylsulfatase [Planctomycetota bacterium]|jgi:arylsulfatase